MVKDALHAKGLVGVVLGRGTVHASPVVFTTSLA